MSWLVRWFLYQVYILQLENYQLGRYLNFILGKVGDTQLVRNKGIVWTKKMIGVVAIAITLWVSSILLAFYLLRGFDKLQVLVVLIAFFSGVFAFGWLILSVVVLSPLNILIKSIVLTKAARKLKHYPNLKIVGITGSYGKTSFKETLCTILQQGLRVVKTPENLNTPLGVASTIQTRLDSRSDVLVVEMGCYVPGDIRKICSLTAPDISVITGINEAHLERMKTISNTIRTKFEIVSFAKTKAKVWLNEDNSLIQKNYEKYLNQREVHWFGQQSSSSSFTNVRFDSRQLVWKAQHKDFEGELEIHILGEYIFPILQACIEIAQELGLSQEQIKKGIDNLKPLPHRLQPIYNALQDIIIIDDSYNGNPEGFKQALRLVEKFEGRRKVTLTPGMVEMGPAAREVHRQLAFEMAKVIDMVLLIRTSVTDYILEGLSEVGFADSKVKIFETREQAHQALSQLLLPSDVVLFQNDWTDNYN